MLAGILRRAASVGGLASPAPRASLADDGEGADEAGEEAPLSGPLQAFNHTGRPLSGPYALPPDRGSDGPSGAYDRPDTPDSVASDSSGRGASSTGMGRAVNAPPARFGLALPPSDHAFWRTPDAPQQALSVLASVERERAAAQVAQRALTSAAEFLTKKNAKLKADLTAAKAQLEALGGGAAGGAEAAAASRRASARDGEAEQQRQQQQHASERAVDSQALGAAQAEVKALRRRVAGLEDALSDSERRHARALRAAQEAGQASASTPAGRGTPGRPGSAPGHMAGSTPGGAAGGRPPSGFVADDVITAGLRDELADANDRIDELEARLEDAAATARAGADAADAAIAAERAKTQAALAALAAASGGSATPSGQVAALRAECEQLRNQAAAAQAKCDQLQRRLRGGDVAVRAERVAAQLEATREAEAQVEALQAELARVKGELSFTSSPSAPSAPQAGDQEEQQRVIDALRAELAATQAALARSRSAARSEVSASSPREVSDLHGAVAAARATAEDASRRCAAAETALRRERATAAEAVSAERTARLAAEAALRRGANSSVALGAPTAAAFTALKQRLDAAEASLVEVTRERDAALTELSNASLAEVERLQSEIDDDLASSREAQSLRGRVEALTQQLREAQAVAAQAQERAAAAERSLEVQAGRMLASQAESSSSATEEAVSLRAALERERAMSRETEEAMLAEAQAQAQTAAALTSQLEVATAALLDTQAALAREQELRAQAEAEAAAGQAAATVPQVHEEDMRQLHAAVQACDAQRQQLLRLEAEFTELHGAFHDLASRLRQAEAAHAELLAAATAREAALQADVTSLAEEAEAAHVHAAAVDSRAAEVQAALEETLEQLAMTRQALTEKPPPGAEAAAVMAARESARASERARYEKQVSQRLEAAHAQWQAERAALQKAAARVDALAEEVVRERAAAEEARAEAAALRRRVAQAARDGSDSEAEEEDSFADAVDHARAAGNPQDVAAVSLAAEEAAALRSALASIAAQRATAEVQAAQAAQRASEAEGVILDLRHELQDRQQALDELRARHDALATAAAAAPAEHDVGGVGPSRSEGGSQTDDAGVVSFLTHDDLDGQPEEGEPDAALAAFELAADALQQRMRRACSLPVREWGAATRVM